MKGQQLSREERKQEVTWKSRGVASWYDEDYADAAAANTASADELCTSSATAKPWLLMHFWKNILNDLLLASVVMQSLTSCWF